MTGKESGHKSSSADAPGRPGLRDVARQAGVSIGTVSNVLNDRGHVHSDLQERVRAAVAELGFVGSRAAGQLRGGRSSLIGVVLPDVGNPFWAEVLRGVETVLDIHDLTLVVASTRLQTNRERSILRVLDSHQVDGLILAPGRIDNAKLDPFRLRPFGLVTLERRVHELQWSSVTLDDVRGGELAATHLLELGYRKLILVNGPDEISWSSERRAGVKHAISRMGLSTEASLVEVSPEGETVADGIRAAEHIATLTDRPAAIICGNDLLALGVLRGLQSRRLRVPDDFALVGYDDVDFAEALSPALSSVRQPSFEMGRAAARLLLQSGPGKVEQVRFEPELVVRASSGHHV